MPSSLKEILSRRALRQQAGQRAFVSGEGYVLIGRVGSLVQHEGTIEATVQGTHEYTVRLWAEDERLGFSYRGCNELGLYHANARK